MTSDANRRGTNALQGLGQLGCGIFGSLVGSYNLEKYPNCEYARKVSHRIHGSWNSWFMTGTPYLGGLARYFHQKSIDAPYRRPTPQEKLLCTRDVMLVVAQANRSHAHCCVRKSENISSTKNVIHDIEWGSSLWESWGSSNHIHSLYLVRLKIILKTFI